MFEGRTRPCLQYQIKRCAAPCVGKVDGPTYAALVQDAELFLQGKTTAVQADLAKQMSTASEAMEFERAASLRDRIKALTQVQQSQGINPRGVQQADVIALHLDHGQACVQVFFIRAHQSWGNRDFYPKTGAGAEEPEIMEAFLAQFYDDKDPPPLILLSHPVENPDLVGQLLSERAGRKVELAVPLRGEKAELLENAARNARESLARRMSESSTQNTLLRGLAEAFDLDVPPMRIEVYDNAHIQGSDAVGGMIVAGAEGFLKSQYRKFNIKSAA
jgi:excinuclease ABC subunit C